jgi:uncharacterized membrane protein (UPF0127 family)
MSNKTPKKQPNETESAHKPAERNYKKLVFALILFIAGFWAIYSGVSSLLDNERRLLTPKGFITVEVVDTPELRAKGLSGRESLAQDKGMLFVFENSSNDNCFWMKDMNFSIDMIWMNEDREVVTVKSSVSPESYPETFCPEGPAKYGLEISDGRANELEIVAGEKLRW